MRFFESKATVTEARDILDALQAFHKTFEEMTNAVEMLAGSLTTHKESIEQLEARVKELEK